MNITSPEFDEALHEAEIAAASLDPADGEDFHRLVQDIDILHRIKRENLRARVPDPTAMFTTAGSLLSIGIVLKHEQLHVIASKAFGLIPKILK